MLVINTTINPNNNSIVEPLNKFGVTIKSNIKDNRKINTYLSIIKIKLIGFIL